MAAQEHNCQQADRILQLEKEGSKILLTLEAIRADVSSFKRYIEKDVSRALNNQADLWATVNKNKEKISNLEVHDAKCPILGVKDDVDRLLKETEMSRVKYKYPEIKSGMRAYHIIKDIIQIIVTTGILITIITNFDKIFAR